MPSYSGIDVYATDAGCDAQGYCSIDIHVLTQEGTSAYTNATQCVQTRGGSRCGPAGELVDRRMISTGGGRYAVRVNNDGDTDSGESLYYVARVMTGGR